MRSLLLYGLLICGISVGYAAEEGGEDTEEWYRKETGFALDLYKTEGVRARIAADCVKSGGDGMDQTASSCGPMLQIRFQR